MKKLFFFDLDGTLLPHGVNQRISDKNIYALKELERIGYDVILNTGKCYDMCVEQLKQFNFKYTITSNGQVLHDNNSVVYRGQFTKDETDFWIDYAVKNNLAIGFQCQEGQFVLDINNASTYVELCFSMLNVAMPKLIKEPDYKVSIQQIWLLGEIDDLNLIDGFDYFKWHKHGLDVQLKGINKGVGVQKFIEHKGYDECEVYTFGDGMNDLSMFEVSTVSVALGNACDEVKRNASYVTCDACDDGVYNFLVKSNLISSLSKED